MDNATLKTALQALRAELAALQGDADAVKGAIAVLERRSGAHLTQGSYVTVGAPVVEQRQVASPPSVPSSASAPTTGEFVEAIVAESDRSWNLPALVEELRARGWVTRSEKPTETVRAALIPLIQKGTVARVAPGVFQKPQDPSRRTVSGADSSPPTISGLVSPQPSKGSMSAPSWRSDGAELPAQEVGG